MRLRLDTQIGQGGGGEVYRATLRPGGQTVAVKRLALEHGLAARQLERLEREAEIIATLEHAHITKLHGVETVDGQVCLVMEFVDGVDLGRVMGAGPVPISASVAIVRALLGALHCAHRAGVVHRDVKPGNVLVSWDGEVKLVDFGMARLEGCDPTTGALVRGTIPYISPEQASGEAVDRRADLFAVGAVFYELLTGRPVWHGRPSEVWGQLVLGRSPTPAIEICPTVPAELNAFAMRLLEMKPEDRPQSAKAALDALPECADGPDALAALMAAHRASGAFTVPVATKPRSSRRWISAAALFAVLGLGAAGFRVFGQAGVPSSGATEAVAQEHTRPAAEAEDRSPSVVTQKLLDGLARLAEESAQPVVANTKAKRARAGRLSPAKRTITATDRQREAKDGTAPKREPLGESWSIDPHPMGTSWSADDEATERAEGK